MYYIPMLSLNKAWRSVKDERSAAWDSIYGNITGMKLFLYLLIIRMNIICISLCVYYCVTIIFMIVVIIVIKETIVLLTILFGV